MQVAGFEPAKHYASDLEPDPFDHSGTPAGVARIVSLLILALLERLQFERRIVQVSPCTH